MFRKLMEVNSRPAPFEFYTAADLWADEHISSKMLEYHIDGSVDISSRKAEFVDQSVDWIISRFDLNEKKSTVDFGCGPGLYTKRLAKCGASVTGIDFSERSIKYARNVSQERGRPVDYVLGNYLDYKSDKRFDLITMIMYDFCALSPDQRRRLLDKFYSLLKPKGSVLLDVLSLSAFGEREETIEYAPNLMDGFWSPEPYYGFLNIFKYGHEKVILDKYTIIEKAKTRVIYNWLQYFDCESLETEFKKSGFAIEEFTGDVAGAAFNPSSSEFAVIASKG